MPFFSIQMLGQIEKLFGEKGHKSLLLFLCRTYANSGTSIKCANFFYMPYAFLAPMVLTNRNLFQVEVFAVFEKRSLEKLYELTYALYPQVQRYILTVFSDDNIRSIMSLQILALRVVGRK